QVWHIIALSVFSGLISGFDIPARQAFVADMVTRREDIGNAIALNSSLFNMARLVGPSLAGITIAAVGEGVCFAINSASFIGAIVALAMFRIHPKPARHKPFVRGLREGFSYAWRFKPIRALLVMLAMLSLVGMPYTVLVPVFAQKILHGGPHTYGLLLSCSGVGALAGAIYLAARRSIVGLGKVMVWSGIIFCTGLLGFAWSRLLWISCLIMMANGVSMIVQTASNNSILQTIVEDDKRGRVMSLYTMAFMGMAPLGSLIAGGLADQFGAPWTVTLGGVVCLGSVVFFARQLRGLRDLVRPIYMEKGLLPNVTPTGTVS
ncbi:MAG: MFS transporter, partial [Verrucomicrobiae bacterium]|nr:MFS transporter [Verrucomicrobiae bacterium]